MWFWGVFHVWNHPRSQWNGEITGEYEYWPTTACVFRLSSSWPRRHEHISHELWPKPGKIGIYHSCQLMSTRIGWPWICIIWGFKRLTFRIHQPGLIYLGFWMWKLPSSLPDSTGLVLCSPTLWPGTRWFEELLGALSPRGNIQRVFPPIWIYFCWLPHTGFSLFWLPRRVSM